MVPALESIRGKLSKPSFETWLMSTKAVDYDDDTLVISAPNDFTRDWLASHYVDLIRDTLLEITGKEIEVRIVNAQPAEAEQRAAGPEKKPAATDAPPKTMLNPRYTFDSFVIGSGNRFAHAASLAVAEAPAKAYNPLFIYGGVGLGKTHLMHAIGHYVLEHNPGSRVVYISSEKFTNEFINSIRDNKTVDFRNKYRNVDILLIDDIQFLAGKEQTQEEFFHTFNTLHEESKQIVISSDRPPKEIPTLEDRLRSRFEWGLITDIQPPDLETRLAILRKKASADNLDIPGEVLAYIADRIDTNIRELEGALDPRRRLFRADEPADHPELAAEALKDIVPKPGTGRQHPGHSTGSLRLLPPEHRGSEGEEADQKRRLSQADRHVSVPGDDRQLPAEDRGTIRGTDHTTVIHAHEKISSLLAKDPQLKDEIEELKKRIRHRR